MELVLAVVLLLVGFYGLIKGADVFVVAASKLAQLFKLPLIIIGLTIVAMGTSAPEAAISITAAYSGATGITIGNIIGSNILNILLVLGVCALVGNLQVARSTKKIQMPFVIFITLALLGLGMIGNSISRLDAIVLVLLFLVFILYLFRLSKHGATGSDDVELLTENDTFIKLAAKSILGIALIVIGSNLTVSSATTLATAFGISDRIIGLTVVAFGTSLPELITSVTAVKKGHNDLAIGNVVGSNIFNILFVLGLSGIVAPTAIPYGYEFLIDSIVAILAVVILWFNCGKKLELTRKNGIIMLLCYGAYFIFLLVK